jgi:hypothetical protein
MANEIYQTELRTKASSHVALVKPHVRLEVIREMFGRLTVSMYFLFEAPLLSVYVACPAGQADPDNFCVDRSAKYTILQPA